MESAENQCQPALHGITTTNTQSFIDICRYEIYQDEVKPNDLSVNFLQEFMELPTSYLAPGAAIKFRKCVLLTTFVDLGYLSLPGRKVNYCSLVALNGKPIAGSRLQISLALFNYLYSIFLAGTKRIKNPWKPQKGREKEIENKNDVMRLVMK